jgi:hypothetical protein
MGRLEMKNFSAHDETRYENKGDNGKANLKRPNICLSCWMNRSDGETRYMIGTLNSGEQWTRRCVTPTGEKESPAKRKELNPRSPGRTFACFGKGQVGLYNASFHLGVFDFLGLRVLLLYTVYMPM